MGPVYGVSHWEMSPPEPPLPPLPVVELPALPPEPLPPELEPPESLPPEPLPPELEPPESLAPVPLLPPELDPPAPVLPEFELAGPLVTVALFELLPAPPEPLLVVLEDELSGFEVALVVDVSELVVRVVPFVLLVVPCVWEALVSSSMFDEDEPQPSVPAQQVKLTPRIHPRMTDMFVATSRARKERAAVVAPRAVFADRDGAAARRGALKMRPSRPTRNPVQRATASSEAKSGRAPVPVWGPRDR